MTSIIRPAPRDLSEDAQQLIIDHALQFDGYAYANSLHVEPQASKAHLDALLNRVQSTGKFSITPAENFAANFYLHRCFYSHGYLPEKSTAMWYDMVLFYLHLYRQPVPAAFKKFSHGWEHRSKGAAERTAAEIRLILHRS